MTRLRLPPAKRREQLPALRLLVAPMLAAIVTSISGLSGLERQVIIVESAMPTAVVTSLFALSFESEPEFVSGAVLFSTLVSPLTLTVVLALVK